MIHIPQSGYMIELPMNRVKTPRRRETKRENLSFDVLREHPPCSRTHVGDMPKNYDAFNIFNTAVDS